jgi:hypothetical protein
MHKKITAFIIAMTTIGTMAAFPMTVNAENEGSRKYTPIVDWLHVTDEIPEYDDMTDPNGPLVGAGSVPSSLLAKINTEQHEDEVPDDIKYDSYYTTRDGSKAVITDDPKARKG